MWLVRWEEVRCPDPLAGLKVRRGPCLGERSSGHTPVLGGLLVLFGRKGQLVFDVIEIMAGNLKLLIRYRWLPICLSPRTGIPFISFKYHQSFDQVDVFARQPKTINSDWLIDCMIRSERPNMSKLEFPMTNCIERKFANWRVTNGIDLQKSRCNWKSSINIC